MRIEFYPAYRDSGIESLGNIPKIWEIKRLKDFSSIVRGGSPRPAGDLRFYEGKIPFLKVGDLTSNEGVYLSTYTHTIKEAGLSNTRLVSKNTLLLTNSGATLGIPKICTFSTTFNDGIAAFTQLKKINQVFLFYFLKSQTKWYLNQASFGQGQPNLNIEIISNTFIPFPSLFEQKAIAHYLDTKTAQIDRKIDLLTQKATLYGSLKQSLINETVTRGLDKSVPMKNSGIDWIGEVPEHWKVTAITSITTIVSIKNHPNEELLSVYRDYGVIVKSTRDDNYNKAGENLAGYKLVKPGFLVINKMKAWQGSLGVSEYRGIVSPAYITCKTNKRIVERSYLHHLLRCRNYINEYNRLSYGVRVDQWDMRYDDFKYVPVLLPPLTEQKAIADYLDTKTAQIDKIIQTINTQIEKLRELRKTLINDVVTGKIKVTDNE